MATLLDHKRGMTFRFVGNYTDANDVPLSLVGLIVTSQVRTAKGDFVDTLDVEFTDAPNGVVTIIKYDTSAWPLGRKLFWDVKISDGPTAVLTDTVNLNIIQQATV